MKEYLKAKDIQTLLGCGKSKAYQIIAGNGFPKVKIGKEYFIPSGEFEKWMKSNLYHQVIL